jgi:hypothetical protein
MSWCIAAPLVKLLLARRWRWEKMDKVASAAEIARTVSENSTASDGEGCLLSPDAADDSLGEGASDDENSWTYYFGSSTITVGKIKEMVEKG